MPSIVIFYSRADENYFGGSYRYIEVGNTEKAAKMISQINGADLFKLEQVKPYSKDYQACIAEAKKDLQNNARPELKAVPDVGGYDEIYLGYPNYWGKMPMAVYTFLENTDLAGKTIHPFCTHEGSGLSGTVNDIKKLCPSAKVASGLALHGSSVDNSFKTIEKWIKED